jgi:hypothetical protein
MSRLTRVAPVGIPQHIIQRGNNRQVCFGSGEDMAAYVSWLKQYARIIGVRLVGRVSDSVTRQSSSNPENSNQTSANIASSGASH